MRSYLESDAARDLIQRIEYLSTSPENTENSEAVFSNQIERLRINLNNSLDHKVISNRDNGFEVQELDSDDERSRLINERLTAIESSDSEPFDDFFEFPSFNDDDSSSKEQQNVLVYSDAEDDGSRSFHLLNIPTTRRKTRASEAAAASVTNFAGPNPEENKEFLARQLNVIEKLMDWGVTEDPDLVLPNLMERANLPADEALRLLEDITTIEDLYFIGAIGSQDPVFTNTAIPTLPAYLHEEKQTRTRSGRITRSKGREIMDEITSLDGISAIHKDEDPEYEEKPRRRQPSRRKQSQSQEAQESHTSSKTPRGSDNSNAESNDALVPKRGRPKSRKLDKSATACDEEPSSKSEPLERITRSKSGSEPIDVTAGLEEDVPSPSPDQQRKIEGEGNISLPPQKQHNIEDNLSHSHGKNFPITLSFVFILIILLGPKVNCQSDQEEQAVGNSAPAAEPEKPVSRDNVLSSLESAEEVNEKTRHTNHSTVSSFKDAKNATADIGYDNLSRNPLHDDSAFDSQAIASLTTADSKVENEKTNQNVSKKKPRRQFGRVERNLRGKGQAVPSFDSQSISATDTDSLGAAINFATGSKKHDRSKPRITTSASNSHEVETSPILVEFSPRVSNVSRPPLKAPSAAANDTVPDSLGGKTQQGLTVEKTPQSTLRDQESSLSPLTYLSDSMDFDNWMRSIDHYNTVQQNSTRKPIQEAEETHKSIAAKVSGAVLGRTGNSLDTIASATETNNCTGYSRNAKTNVSTSDKGVDEGLMLRLSSFNESKSTPERIDSLQPGYLNNSPEITESAKNDQSLELAYEEKAKDVDIAHNSPSMAVSQELGHIHPFSTSISTAVGVVDDASKVKLESEMTSYQDQASVISSELALVSADGRSVPEPKSNDVMEAESIASRHDEPPTEEASGEKEANTNSVQGSPCIDGAKAAEDVIYSGQAPPSNEDAPNGGDSPLCSEEELEVEEKEELVDATSIESQPTSHSEAATAGDADVQTSADSAIEPSSQKNASLLDEDIRPGSVKKPLTAEDKRSPTLDDQYPTKPVFENENGAGPSGSASRALGEVEQIDLDTSITAGDHSISNGIPPSADEIDQRLAALESASKFLTMTQGFDNSFSEIASGIENIGKAPENLHGIHDTALRQTSSTKDENVSDSTRASGAFESTSLPSILKELVSGKEEKNATVDMEAQTLQTKEDCSSSILDHSFADDRTSEEAKNVLSLAAEDGAKVSKSLIGELIIPKEPHKTATEELIEKNDMTAKESIGLTATEEPNPVKTFRVEVPSSNELINTKAQNPSELVNAGKPVSAETTDSSEPANSETLGLGELVSAEAPDPSESASAEELHSSETQEKRLETGDHTASDAAVYNDSSNTANSETSTNHEADFQLGDVLPNPLDLDDPDDPDRTESESEFERNERRLTQTGESTKTYGKSFRESKELEVPEESQDQERENPENSEVLETPSEPSEREKEAEMAKAEEAGAALVALSATLENENKRAASSGLGDEDAPQPSPKKQKISESDTEPVSALESEPKPKPELASGDTSVDTTATDLLNGEAALKRKPKIIVKSGRGGSRKGLRGGLIRGQGRGGGRGRGRGRGGASLRSSGRLSAASESHNPDDVESAGSPEDTTAFKSEVAGVSDTSNQGNGSSAGLSHDSPDNNAAGGVADAGMKDSSQSDSPSKHQNSAVPVITEPAVDTTTVGTISSTTSAKVTRVKKKPQMPIRIRMLRSAGSETSPTLASPDASEDPEKEATKTATETGADAKAESKTKAKTKSKAKSKAGAKSEAKSESEAKAKSEATTASVPDAAPSSEPDTSQRGKKRKAAEAESGPADKEEKEEEEEAAPLEEPKKRKPGRKKKSVEQEPADSASDAVAAPRGKKKPRAGRLFKSTDNRLYCTCRQKESAFMIRCDNEDCKFEWFHFTCLGIDKAPDTNKWYCADCLASKAKNQKTELLQFQDPTRPNTATYSRRHKR